MYSKHAGLADIFGAVKGVGSRIMNNPHVQASVIPMAVAGAGTMAYAGIRAGVQAQQKAKAYKEIMDMHPELRRMDADQVQHVFNTLHRLNPTIAKDPVVGGAQMMQVMEAAQEGFGKPTMTSIGRAMLGKTKDLAEIRRSMSQAGHGTSPLQAYSAIHSTVKPMAEAAGKALDKDIQGEHAQRLSGLNTDWQEAWNQKEQEHAKNWADREAQFKSVLGGRS